MLSRIFSVKFVTVLISFIFSIVLTNTLSQSDVGVYLTGMTLMAVISIFVKSGFDTYLIKINADITDKFSNYCNLVLLTLIPYAISISVWLIFFIKQDNVFLLFVIAAWSMSYFMITSAYLKTLGKIKLATIVESSLLHLLLIIVYLTLPIDINLYNSIVILFTISTFLSICIFVLLYLNNRSKINLWKISFVESFSKSFSIMLTNLLDFLVIWLPSFILFLYATTEITAQFQIALRVSILAALPLMALNNISSPIIALYLKRSATFKLSELLQTSSLLGAFVTSMLIVFLLVFKDTVFGFFGDSYIIETSVLMLLLVGQFVNVISGSVGLTLMISGYGWVHFINSVLGIVLSLIVAAFVMPQDLIIGATIGTMLAISIKNILGVICVYKIFKIVALPNRQAFSNLKIKRINEIFSNRN